MTGLKRPAEDAAVIAAKNSKSDKVDVEIITLSDEEDAHTNSFSTSNDAEIATGEADDKENEAVLPLTPPVEEMDPKEAWLQDRPVINALKEVLASNHQDLTVVPAFSTELTEFDKKSIEKRLKEIRGSQLTDEGKTKKPKNNKKKKMHKCKVNKYPFVSPHSYELIGERQDSHGTLQFYDASPSSDGKLEKMPDYKFIDKNELDEVYSNEPVRSLAETFKCDCSSTCNLQDGCKPETCSCMKKSSLVSNIVDESRLQNQIVECSADCPCYKRSETCPSIIQYRKLKFHVVYMGERMGFALRVMQPVHRGEPIIEFTGVRTNYVSKLDEDWAYTSANCDTAEARKLTGIKDETASVFINPLRKGNAGRFIAHSGFPNVAWIMLFRGGMKTVEPEAIVYAVEPLEAGDILYIDYGESFGISKRECRCTQALCHDEKKLERLRRLPWNQGMSTLIEREVKKRKRIVERDHQAKLEYLTDMDFDDVTDTENIPDVTDIGHIHDVAHTKDTPDVTDVENISDGCIQID